MNVQPQTCLLNPVYPVFVLGMIVVYVLLAVIPYFATGIHHYSYQEVSNQTVPGFPYGTLFGVGAMVAIMYVPLLSLFPGMFVLSSFPSERHLYSSFERNVIGFTLAALVLLLGFMFLWPIRRTMSTWILD